MYRHRCYCCVGKTMHESGNCITCGGVGFLFDPAETLSHTDTVQHRYIIHRGGTCKLTAQEREAALRFITAGEPNTYDPEEGLADVP